MKRSTINKIVEDVKGSGCPSEGECVRESNVDMCSKHWTEYLESLEDVEEDA